MSGGTSLVVAGRDTKKVGLSLR